MIFEYEFESYCHNVKFSPSSQYTVAVVGGQNFGLDGPGNATILQYGDKVRVSKVVRWSDVLTDIYWRSPDDIVASSGDGHLIFASLMNRTHDFESSKLNNSYINSIDYHENSILAGSWDSSVILFNLATKKIIQQYCGHQDLCFDVKWSKFNRNVFASSGADGKALIWDKKSDKKSIALFHGVEVLCLDWSPIQDQVLISGSTDGKIRCWDIRKASMPTDVVEGHEYAVKRVKYFSNGKKCASSSYDFLTKLWEAGPLRPVKTYKNHSEFVYGLDIYNETLATCSWDKRVKIFFT